jgi:hypothetical protein
MNLDSFARWQIIPTLNRCGVCKKAKHLCKGTEPDHQYQRDLSMPTWKGWHGFRRGSAGYVARQSGSTDGVDLARLQLRKSDRENTQASYVQHSKQERRVLVAQQEIDRAAKKQSAATTIAKGVKPLPSVN